ncbi:PAS domain S-box-containing protein/diguanylate cyclase (GGDEF)-like protein [Herminiimonas fonticola]|uniref:PAS domain S-box-containing protein/diguanylate cyclase (GGDEF)-like protein n=2 Tax=Herminiimonas fonticola TaxID=303380 RepID=A0A4R6G338_9BURK|nr:GGDEF: diguanylate cyclase (GGDEF) domain [Herminiimonas fonticola]TDN88005.1 PAS domain S-box-containing protein/diguanylate cyclase (GGDEF)-like protein [Herminiimonas fonticola]
MEMTSHAPLASFIDLLMDAVFAVNADGCVVFASASCERIFGYTPQEMVGKTMFDMIVEEDRERTRQSARDVMLGYPQFHFENRYIRKDGQIVHIMWATRWSPADQLRIGVARDITGLKRAESMQAVLYLISEAAYAAEDLIALFKRIHQIVGTLLPADNFSVTLYDEEKDQLSFPYRIDEVEQTSDVSKPAAGTLCAEIIRSGQPLLLTPETMAARLEELQVTAEQNLLCWLGVPLKSHKGMIGVLMVKTYVGGACYSEKDQELLQFVSTQIAIAIERQQMQSGLLHMAQYDQLTALPNRGFLYDRLKVALATARREQGRLSVLYLDLDKFKQVNDTLGHDIGDLLLQEVAKRLKQCMRESDTVARIGGDEFVVLLPSISLPEQAELVAEKVRHALNSPFNINGHYLNIRSSIGIALYPEHGDNEQQLLKHADNAMYLAKNNDHRSRIDS